MAQRLNRWTRKLHRWGAILIAIPLLLVIVSGLLLQVKKHWTWIQPPTTSGSQTIPTIQFDDILAAAKTIPQANIHSWDDIDRLDVRPGKGMVKVRSNNRWEVQVDLANGDVLTANYRRSDFIESLHDGTFFGDAAKLWLFLPNGCILLGLWIIKTNTFFY